MTTAQIMDISVRQLEIIDAAGRILSSSGVNGLTIKNLAKEMQFSESAIYRHFASKEDIIISMLEFLSKNMDGRLQKASTMDQNAETKFRAIFENQFTFFMKNSHYVVAVFSDGLLEESERINETILKIMEVKRKHLMDIIEEGQKGKLFTNSLSSDELTQIVMGSFRLLMLQWRIANFKFDIIKKGNDLTNSILKLIKR